MASKYTYVIGPAIPSSGKVKLKIGQANDPGSRLKSLQTGHPDRLSVLAQWDNAGEFSESRLHREFRPYKADGGREWFILPVITARELVSRVPPASALPPYCHFRNKASNREVSCRLVLYWELDRDCISDNYALDAVTAYELFNAWVREVTRESRRNEDRQVPVHWSVESVGEESGAGGMCEGSPLGRSPNFLTYFTHPVDGNNSYVNWYSLPVVSKLWQAADSSGWPVKSSKGGQIQGATGWKPTAFQPSVSLQYLIHRAWMQEQHRLHTEAKGEED